MHKDPNLRKRNALVIPGGLLTLLSVVGMGYVALLRGDNGTCEDSSLIVLGGACRSAMLVLAIPLVVGLALVGSGALAFRSKATCRHGWGSWAHFGLALLIGLVVVPLLGMLLSPSLVGEDAAIVRGGVDYPVTTVLAGVTAIGVIALVPFLGLYVGRARANPCCNEKGCFDPCFCDEPVAAGEDAIPPPPESGPLEDPVLATAAPPEPVPEPMPEPAPAPAPEAPAAPAPEPAPAAAPAEAWAPLPDEPEAGPEPAAQWEQLPDEEPAPPATEEKPARKAAAAAPPLATRPTDPAAPPQDAMATAAKWAEEDAEAEREMLGSDAPARDYKAAASGKGSAKPKKASKKKTLTKAKPGKAPKPKKGKR